MSDSSSSYLVAARRTPIGRFLGGLSTIPAPQLAARATAAALDDCGLPADAVDQAIVGNVLSAGVGQAPARQAALLAGCPPTVPAVTVNMVCGSGLKAVMLADQAVRAGDAQIVVAAGMESMSRAPFLLAGPRQGWKFGDQRAIDSMIHDGLQCATEKSQMGELAEQLAKQKRIGRAQQDAYAAESHRRAVAAITAGQFDAQLVSVPVRRRQGDIRVDRDEGPRDRTTPESLAQLPPAFASDGTVTAGNASQLSDGGAALVVTSKRVARSIDSPVKARIVAACASGVAPQDLFLAPIDAIQKVLHLADLKLEDIDLVELSEAFAVQCLACMKPLGLNPQRTNVHGGAIAMGHPIGASGARILVALLHALAQQGKARGLAALCLGGGNGLAMIVEREEAA